MTILTQSACIALAPSVEDSTPRIYVACLSSYAAGKLHGAWVDCDQDSYAIQWEIDAMLAESTEENAEEWAIHDSENWQGITIDESEDLGTLADLAKILKENGGAYAAYCGHVGKQYASVEDFKDTYRGVYESEANFVEESWDESGKLNELANMGMELAYINFDAIARDWFINDYYSVELQYQQVYVFSNR